MASIIPGYNYDIFISYRQNDNKYDGWVTEFVDNLNKELEANIKDKVSVYFDINPKDGLLETDSVDKSLEDKLKCLIFIPVISRTYCDPKSFAWQHEFCAFNKQANEDMLGRDIKLASGNVASRILPVKIHELDPEDTKLLENELGEVLRGIEFIYKDAGVNRPLRANEDHPQDNLNKTYYRDQINKVANAVKEVLTALKKQGQHPEEITREVSKPLTTPQKSKKTPIIIVSVAALALIILGILFIPKLLKHSKEIEKSIAVLPFDNLNSDEEQAWFSDGITDVVINQLSKISDIRIIGRTSTLKYKQERKSITEIGKELGVNYIIEGTVQLQANKMRISVQLVRVINESHIWSNIYDKEWKDIFDVQGDIAIAIAEELETVLTTEEKAEIEKLQTNDLEAYNFYLQGRYFWYMRTEEGLRKSIEYFNKAIDIDTNYALAYAGLADAYYIQAYRDWIPWKEGTDRAKETALKALDIDENLSEAHTVLGALLKYREWKWEEARKELLLAVDLNPEYATAYQYYSDLLDIFRENKEARKQLNVALEIDPFLPLLHAISSSYYYNEGKLKEALDECQLVEELDVGYDDRGIYWREFNIYLKLQEELKAVSALQKALNTDTIDTEISNLVLDTYNNSGIGGIWVLLIESETKKPNPNALRLANIYATLDDKENALAWLEKALEDPPAGLPSINNNPDFDKLRSESRFQVIIRKMGLSEYQEPK